MEYVVGKRMRKESLDGILFFFLLFLFSQAIIGIQLFNPNLYS